MREDWRQETQLLLLAVQGLTRIRVPRDLPFSDDLRIRSIRYFPLVGACVGIVGGAVLWIGALWYPPVVAVLLSLAATLLISGGLHENGLVQAAEDLGGDARPGRAAEALRTARIGTLGAVTLGVTLALKVALLVAVPTGVAVALLVVGHGISRMAVVHVIATTPDERDHGARFVAPAVTPDGYRIALATTLALIMLCMLVLGVGAAFCAALGSIGLGQAIRFIFVSRFGGYTLACQGATQQMGELGFYLGALFWL